MRLPTDRKRSARPALTAGLALATTAAIAFTALVPTAASADPVAPVIAKLSFDDGTTGLAGGGAKATVTGTYATGAGADGTAAAKLSSANWLTVTKTDGSPLLTGLNDVTFSYDSKPDTASANLGWTVVAQRSTATTTYQNEHYLGVMDKSSSVIAERYNNSGTRVSTGNLSATATPAGWKHVDVVLSGTSGKLYINGSLAASNTAGALLTDILGSSGGVLQLGKANWVSGEYYSGLVDNLTIYGGALTEAEVQASAAQGALAQIPSSLTIESTNYVLPGAQGVVTWTSQLAAVVVGGDGRTATVTRPATGSPAATGTLTATVTVGSQTLTKDVTVTVTAPPSDEQTAQAALDGISIDKLYDVRTDLTLPTTGAYDRSISWTSSNPGVISDSVINGIPAGVVKRASTQQIVTLTAKVGSLSRIFTAVVRAKAAPVETTDYVFAHFTGTEGSATAEQIYFATSNDGDTYSDTRPNNQPVLSWNSGDRGVRDPYLVRSPEGDTFYLIATDLSIYYRGGWGNAQATTTGSLSLVVWESNDLVHWSAPRLTDVASGIAGAGMAWAPEAFWDDAKQQYVAYWATASSATNQLGDATNVYYATTRDFRTWSAPVKWIDRSGSVIDTTMTKVGDWYYRASGDGQITIERSKDLYAITTAATAPAYVDDNHWALVGTLSSIFNNTNYSGAKLEGPEFFEYNIDDRDNASVPLWGLMADQYAAGAGYLPFRTTNIGDASTSSWSTATDVNFGALKKRHGTILAITAAEFAAIRAAAVGSTGSLVDTTAPALSNVSVTPSGQWTSTGTLSWTATDDSGLTPSVEVKVGSGTWQASGNSLIGLAQGANSVSVRAVDSAGNRSAATVLTVNYDSVAPVSTAVADSAARSMTLAATDATSGVASVQFSTDGSTWSTYGSPVIAGSGATTVWYRAVDAAGNVEVARSVAFAAVSTPAPVPSTFTAAPVPVVTGTARVGSVLTATAGTWSPAPVGLAFQWFRGDAPIAGASGTSYSLVAADLGAAIHVVVTGSKAGFTTASTVSAPTGKVAAGLLTSVKPKIKGTAKVGSKLKVTAGKWTPSSVKLTYRWYRSGKAISGATKASYTLKKADKGKKITVKVTGKLGGYTTKTVSSASTKKVR